MYGSFHREADLKREQVTHLARLRELVASMERDLALDSFSPDEKNVICAMASLEETASDGNVHSSDIKLHQLCSTMSKPTFYRVLSSLLRRNIIVKTGTERAGTYTLKP